MKRNLFTWGAVLLLLAGLALSVSLSLDLRRAVERDARAELAADANEAVIKLQERLASYAIVLESGAALFHGSDAVSRADWRNFVQRLDLPSNLPGIQAMGYTAWIPGDRLPAFLAQVRQEWPGYPPVATGTREPRALVLYIEPMSGRNLRALGYDSLPEPERRAALERARDTGEVTLSGPVHLEQEDGVDVQTGMLMFAPVYRADLPLATVAQRRAALQGWVFSPYRMQDFMAGVFQDWRHAFGHDLHLSLYAGDSADAATRLFVDAAMHQAVPGFALTEQRRLEFAGQRWLMVFTRHPDSMSLDYTPAWMALAAGSLISLLLAGLVLTIGRIRVAAGRMAATMTADLRASAQKLKESEYRSKFALEGADLGVWDRDLVAGTVFQSKRWLEIIGHGAGEVGPGMEEWLALLHPEDRPAVLAQVQAVLEGRQDVYASEHRLQDRDGRYKWVLDRGMVVERAADGAPQRMVGTLADIDARKRLELDLEKYRRLFELSTEPMCIVDTELRLVAANPVFCALVGEPEAELLGQAPTRFIHPEDHEATWQALAAYLAGSESVALENRYFRPDGRIALLSWRAFVDREKEIVYCSARDITESRRARERIERLDKLYAALSACNAAIVHCTSEQELFAEICQIIVRYGGLQMAWIGRIDPATRRVLPVQSFGAGTEYVEGIDVTLDPDDPHGHGPVGIAGRENHPVWMNDVAHNPAFAPWLERAGQYGWRAVSSLPICRGGTPVALLSLYASNDDFFDEEIRQLLIEMAADIGYALDKLAAEAESEASRTSLLEADHRFHALVEQAIAGAYIIQDGRFVYVNPRFAAILGHDDPAALLGSAVDEAAAPADRPRLLASIQRLISGEVSRLETAFSALRADGRIVDVNTNSSVASYRGRPAVIGLMQDMSDRQVAEDQVRRYADKLEHLLLGTVGMVTSISDLRDPYTAGHERHVANIAAAIGRELGFDDGRIEGLRIAGLLHDVGNILIPAEILSKPGKLSDTEFGIIKEHARAGHDVLKEVDFPWPVAQVALQHHERLDGSGYPAGLKAVDILLEARIIAVADVVEAMSSHRPFRPALGLEAALAEVEQGAGTLYDAEVVAACLRLFREKGFLITR